MSSGSLPPAAECRLFLHKFHFPALHHGGDVIAVFEVAYSSLLSDRRTKQWLYASQAIPVYVIINLQDELIEVLSEPLADEQRYQAQSVYRTSETVIFDVDQFGPLSFLVDSVI